MALIRWRHENDLFSQLERLQREMNTWMSSYRPSGGPEPSAFHPDVYPPLNIYEDGEGYMVRAEIPGVDPKVIDIEATADTLTIRGERPIPEPSGEFSYHRRERDSGQFRRAFTLPNPIDNSKVVAACVNGVLEIRLPFAEEAKRRKITVKAT